MPRKTSEK
jgi:hypothetical protein